MPHAPTQHETGSVRDSHRQESLSGVPVGRSANSRATNTSARSHFEIEGVGNPQSFDHAAVDVCSFGTVCADLAQATFEAAQFADLLPDLPNPGVGYPLEIGTAIGILSAHGNKPVRFLDAEPEITKPPDEQELPGLVLIIPALFPLSAFRLWHQANPLIVADRINPTFRQPGQFADPERRP